MIPEKVSGQQQLEGPVYQIPNKHNFNQIADRVQRLEKLEGPCYDILHAHNFNPTLPKTDNPLTLKYPVFDVDHRSVYCQIVQKIIDLNPIMNSSVNGN